MTPPSTHPADDSRTSQTAADVFAAFREAVAARREAELRCARLLARMDDERLWEAVGCANVGEFGERNGLAALEARALLDLGRALRLHPELADEIRGGQVTVAAAACASQVLTQPDLQRPDDDWGHWARTESLRSLRRRVRERREQVRIGDEPACAVSVFVRPKARDDFERAREIASSRAGRPLTEGETFETVVDHFLDSFDLARVTPGSRRAPNTSLYRSRYVPMEVRREIYGRQGSRCAVPFCDNTMFLEKAHLVPHASGGDREADNLVLLCADHHLAFDGGVLRLEGTAASPRFFDREGHDLAQRGPGYELTWDDDEFDDDLDACAEDRAEDRADEIRGADPDLPRPSADAGLGAGPPGGSSDGPTPGHHVVPPADGADGTRRSDRVIADFGADVADGVKHTQGSSSRSVPPRTSPGPASVESPSSAPTQPGSAGTGRPPVERDAP